MKIAFILPMPTIKIVGGYKKVYEYANYLSLKGNKVTIFYNSNRGKNSKRIPKLITFIIRSFICRLEPRWFKLSKNVKKVNLYRLKKERFNNNFDVVIATAAETASFVNSLKVKKKIYFIQDFEINWKLSKDKLINTYNYDMDLIVVSKWLCNKVKKYTLNPITYIPNGINNNIFYDKKYKRINHSIAMLYHNDYRKGSDVGLKVIFKLKQIYPDLVAYLFGTPERPKNLPKWIIYVRSATSYQVAELMNKSKIFLCSSRSEGFGLTGLESLFCGCILVTTDCGGIREYAAECNSFICNVDDVTDITNNVIKAFENIDVANKKKQQIKVINKFELKNSLSKFLKLVTSSEE